MVKDFDVILIDNVIIGIIFEKQFLTVRGLLKYNPKNRFVPVDMGAVKFVNNGADIMTPGIVDADRDIKKDDYYGLEMKKTCNRLLSVKLYWMQMK